MVAMVCKLFATGALVLNCQSSLIAQQNQLPIESAIPGEHSSSSADIPDESEIPGQPKLVRELASESVLPPSSSRRPVVAEDDAAVAEDAQDGLREFAQRPMLRIRGEGPVATLKSVCFSADSKRIFAGGLDKTLHVWQRIGRAGVQATWAYEKPVDWQINRSTQGQIFAVAAGKKNIIFGGIGASATNGEIILLDNDQVDFSTALADVDRGHVDSVFALATDSENRVIASTDIVGRTIVWRRDDETGKWEPEQLRASDADLFKEQAAQIRGWRSRGGAIAISDSLAMVYAEVAVPLPTGTVPNWNLIRIAANGEKTQLLAPEFHQGAVVSIACSGDGQRIVSADLRNDGRIFLWDLSISETATVLKTQFPIRCLELSADGSQLLLGTARDRQGIAKAQLFNWAVNQPLVEVALWDGAADVEACAFSPDESQIVFTRGATLIVVDRVTKGELQTLDSKMRTPTGVAFCSVAGEYRCLLQTDSSEQKYWSFDPGKLNLIPLANNALQGWIEANPRPDNWQLKTIVDPQTTLRSYAVFVDGNSFCNVPLDQNQVGDISCHSFVADANDARIPAALIIGTSGKNHVYVFRIGTNRCELVREYRGHTAAVTSVGVSQDGQYLASAAFDGTASFWKLSAAFADEAWQRPTQSWTNRWGAEFTIVDGRLMVTDIVEDGPLYFRGVRKDDQIEKMVWSEGDGQQQILTDPAAMRSQLSVATSSRLTRFEYRRGGLVQPYFYLYPAWQPLASFAWDRQHEWAFWTPYGYYDASFNGHKFFAWQINQGVNRPVKFFRAAELKEELECPAMMQNLFSSGSVASAFKVARLDVPQGLSERLSATSRLQPEVEITSVQHDQRDDLAEVTAQIKLAEGVELGSVKAFANGVPGVAISPAKRIVAKSSSGDRSQAFEIRFEFKLPHDNRIKLQVLAASALGHGAMAETVINGPAGLPAQPPRIFVMALGVSQYQDSQIPSLDFAHLNADSVLKELAGTSEPNDQAILLTNRSVSKSMWTVTSRSLAEEMKQLARPDDLLVVFLSGHGFRDPVDQEYFFLTSATKYSDVLSRRYGECISFDELSAFGKIGCRKLVILDTCHSGAIQALRQQNLKSVVRTLENDLFFTLTASEGADVAYESKQRERGLFTSRLIDALEGQSDLPAAGGDGNGIVTLRETVRFVKTAVPADAARLGNYQFPTASPADLLELAEIGLTKVPATERGSKN